jgi:predicted secreted protein
MGWRSACRLGAAVLGASLLAPPVEAAAPAERVARYVGILPCADCPALRVDLVLRGGPSPSSGRYEERLTYVDRGGRDQVQHGAGRWRIVKGSAADPAATLYRLTDARYGSSELLRVEGDRSLRVVDDRGRDIPSPIPQVLWRAEPRFAGKPLVVDKAHAQRTLVLKPGQELVVRLASNPTTGYRWTLGDASVTALAMSATPAYRQDPAAEGVMGAGGVETWRFLAIAPGRAKLSLEYRRPWEHDAAPAEAIVFDVQVRDSAKGGEK